MSALGDLAGAAGGVVTGGLWKVGAIVLAGLLVATGGGWWLAAHDRDVAKVDLRAAHGESAALRASLDIQNSAIANMQLATAAADARGLAAQKLAAANAKRFDGALAKLEGARATTCDEAMPAVNQLLKDIK